MIKLERPIFPITETSTIQKKPKMDNGYHVRFGKKTPFDDIPTTATVGEYVVGNTKWYELYFCITRNVQETD